MIFGGIFERVSFGSLKEALILLTDSLLFNGVAYSSPHFLLLKLDKLMSIFLKIKGEVTIKIKDNKRGEGYPDFIKSRSVFFKKKSLKIVKRTALTSNSIFKYKNI